MYIFFQVGGFGPCGITNKIAYFSSVNTWLPLSTIPHIECSNFGCAVLQVYITDLNLPPFFKFLVHIISLLKNSMTAFERHKLYFRIHYMSLEVALIKPIP